MQHMCDTASYEAVNAYSCSKSQVHIGISLGLLVLRTIAYTNEANEWTAMSHY